MKLTRRSLFQILAAGLGVFGFSPRPAPQPANSSNEFAWWFDGGWKGGPNGRVVIAPQWNSSFSDAPPIVEFTIMPTEIDTNVTDEEAWAATRDGWDAIKMLEQT